MVAEDPPPPLFALVAVAVDQVAAGLPCLPPLNSPEFTVNPLVQKGLHVAVAMEPLGVCVCVCVSVDVHVREYVFTAVCVCVCVSD